MAERLGGVDVDIDHTAIFLDDVPDLHAREGENRSELGGCYAVKCGARGESRAPPERTHDAGQNI